MKIFISSCLLGKKCAYDGLGREIKYLDVLYERFSLIDRCPEVAGGLDCPREINEIVGGTGKDVLQGNARVISLSGKDNTERFIKGAETALGIARDNGVRIAVLKTKSPSCGKYRIHAGTFDGRMKNGAGVTTALFELNNIKVFTEYEIYKAAKDLSP